MASPRRRATAGMFRRGATAIFRAAGLAFQPAATLIGRLRYAQKFAVVGLVLLVPLGLVANAYVSLQRGQIAFSAKERHGVAYLQPLIALVEHMVAARHQAVGTPGTGQGRLDPQLTADLDADLANLAAVDLQFGAELGVTADWRAARGRLLGALARVGSADSRYPAFNTAVDALLELVVRVGDTSNLTLDPDLDTYYLMDTLQFRLPVLLDVAGRSIDRAALAAGFGQPDHTVLIELGLANGVLTSTLASIDRAIRTVGANTQDPWVREATQVGFSQLAGATLAVGNRLSAAVATGSLTEVPFGTADETRAAAVRFATITGAALDHLLRARIDRFASRARQVEVGTGAAVLLALYLFVGFYLSLSRPIRRIVATLHAVGEGDLSVRVSVDTQDELSYVAAALNETVAQTEIVTRRLSVQASQDGLTGLPNRALALDRLQQALLRSQRSGVRMAVLFVDLDRFKLINDSRGHEAGDEVLTAVAGRLTAMARPGDTVARLAGDEFVVISEGLGTGADAVRLAERIVAGLSAPIPIRCGGDREVSVGASVGIALTDGGTTLLPEDLLRDADVAMYRAKERGRGRVEVFDDALRVAVQRRMEIQQDLRQAVAGGQLRVLYQPIVDTRAGLVVGVEALVRWQHPSAGLLGPGEFLDVAEETGLIVPLGAAVLAEACRQAAAWRAGEPGCERLHVAVNVSSAQFSHPSFVPTVAAVLADSGLPPDALWLEITETSIMTDAAVVGSTLAAIRALGAHLAIDDFGTGYSSLAYLRRFPVEMLKIDRSFVAGLGQDREDEAIVAMVISLARTLDLVIVAEGVETADQLELLRRLGCETVQGYYFGRPAAADLLWGAARPALVR
ncbi:MAG TPA: EAL domain-containing protein [Mycobacteriales bacterium]|nr:EAL domain-containing protein [Mycobacteriales bacterium]